MAKPELGAKRQCQSCGTKFFDMNKDPILCPKCGAHFVVVAPVSRAAARAAAAEDEEAETSNDAELVSLEDADGAESKEAGGDDDIEIEGEEGGDDDTFLEEDEEDGDDVSGLIDGDIESDEEG
ncbi:MAG: TIGR02300 family protein [Hyphomicrobiales bacterium]|nr:TIGR02300 family protein [Hyphomicrobiales bacterium]